MFSDASIKKILKKAGAIIVSKSAITKFKKIAEYKLLIIARKAVKNAEYSGRKSVTGEDIKEAMKKEGEEE